MKIGVIKEIKDHEFRVGMIPAGVMTAVTAGHEVSVECDAGEGSGISNDEYLAAGARIVDGPEEIYGESDLVVKVKEPLLSECPMMRRGLMLFTYLHLAPLPELTEALVKGSITGIAYETIVDPRGRLPLLTPMSEVAGRMAVLAGAYYLQRNYGGRGTLLAGVPGVPPGDVVILGGGIVGHNAARVALGLGARVTVLDTNIDQLRFVDDLFRGAVTTLASNPHNMVAVIGRADLLIGAVLVPGRSAPKLVTREMLAAMKPGAVIVDVAVDQGGCVETTHPTTHSEPVFVVDGVLHYCVANMPGAVPRTSTFALNNVTSPYVLAIANKGLERALAEDPGLVPGVNTHRGAITSAAVAESQDRTATSLGDLLDIA